MVPTISKDGGTWHSTSVTESTPQTATITRNMAELSIMEQTTTNSGTFVRCVQMEGLSSGVSEVIMASWRPGRKVVYNRAVQRWLEYCGRWGYHPQHTTLKDVLDFLHAFFTQGLGYSDINSHRSALSSILQVPGLRPIGEHVLISQFMKGVYSLWSPHRRYSEMWDIC